MTDTRRPIGVAQARRGEEVRQLRLKVKVIDRQLGNVFGPVGQTSQYMIGLQPTLRAEKDRLEQEIDEIEALSDDDLRTRYSPKPVEPVTQVAGYNRRGCGLVQQRRCAPRLQAGRGVSRPEFTLTALRMVPGGLA